jgi:predicted nucleic acid-binding protein
MSTMIAPATTLAVSPDETDNRFLECAEAAGADFLVTGNRRHFPNVWKTTRIVSARELVEFVLKG